MREYIDFIYDGKSSKDLGVIQAYRDMNLYEESFMSSRIIIEEKVRGNDTPYFFGVEREPLEFEFGLFFSDELSNVDKRRISRMLDQDTYKPLIFNENDGQIFYCMPVQSPNIIHNGLNKGFIELTMRCDSPYSYSPVYRSKTYLFDDKDDNSDNREFIFTNNGDKNCKPVLHIQKIGSGDVSIKSFHDDQEVTLKNLSDKENVVIDGVSESVESDIPLTSRYDDFNNRYLSLPLGESSLYAEGDFKLKIEYRLAFIQEVSNK